MDAPDLDGERWLEASNPGADRLPMQRLSDTLRVPLVRVWKR